MGGGGGVGRVGGKGLWVCVRAFASCEIRQLQLHVILLTP